MLACLLWIISLLLKWKDLFPQPLLAPLLAYVTLSGISTTMSPDPYMSWGRMSLVCAGPLIALTVAQNLHTLSQVRALLALLLLSATTAAGFTAWQYSYGMGAQVTAINATQTSLYRAGIRLDDIITSVGGKPVRNGNDLTTIAEQSPPRSVLHIRFLRGAPYRKHEAVILAGDLLNDQQRRYAPTFTRGRPSRAQGTLGHYTIFAELLMLIACMAWALLLGTPASIALRTGLLLIFLAITATVLLTQTRSALAGLVLGCAVMTVMLARWKSWRLSAPLAVLLILTAIATLWIRHARGLNWVDNTDVGTQYRLVLWQDGIRLALQHPVFGVGMETVHNHWQEWNMLSFREFHAYYNFHSDLVQIVAERGFLTLIAWLWFLAAYLAYLLRLIKEVRPRSQFATSVVVGVTGGFVAYLLTSQVLSVLYDDSPLMMLFLCCGIAMAIGRIAQTPSGRDNL